MDTKDFVKEIARHKGVTEETAYRYVNTVMDTIRIVLTEGREIKIGSFGKFTVVTDIEGNKTPMLCPAKSFRAAVNEGEGRI